MKETAYNMSENIENLYLKSLKFVAYFIASNKLIFILVFKFIGVTLRLLSSTQDLQT